MRSKTCKSSSNQYLFEYHTQFAAEEAATEANATYGNQVKPYKCTQCGYWHLSSAGTRRQCQHCTDSQLFLKDIYSTMSEAQQTANHLFRTKKIQLYPYRCKHGSGWHLTKRKLG